MEILPSIRAAQIKKFIAKYVRVPEGPLVGKPMELLPEQTAFIDDVYGRVDENGTLITRRGILSTPKKNGKTGLISAIMQAHIYGPEARLNGNVYSAARSRDQASFVFNYAQKSIRANPKLENLVQITDSSKRIVGLLNNVTYKALSSDATTAHGGSPNVVLHDELGQVIGPTDAFYDALETSGGAHDEFLSLIISTQAATDNDLLSILIDDAKDTNDPRSVVHLYEVPKDADVFDMAELAKANFALGKFRSRKDLEEYMQRAKRIPTFEARFRNLFANQRITQHQPFVPVTLWREASWSLDEVFLNNPVSIGMDLSQRLDLTAVVACAVDSDTGITHLKVWPFTPEVGLEERAAKDRAPYITWRDQGHLLTLPGTVINYGDLLTKVAELTQAMDVQQIFYDRWRIDMVKAEAEKVGWAQGAEWIPCGQGFKDMSPRLEQFESLVVERRLAHDHNPVMTAACFGGIAIEDSARNRKLEKKRSNSRIDPLVAAVMAIPVMQSEASGPMIFMLG